LCDELISELQSLQATHSFDIEVLDVDRDAMLTARYGERVPVLVCAEGELCHFRLDAVKVNDYLEKIG
jgi:Glutaredoxin-like domain (DUF836)